MANTEIDGNTPEREPSSALAALALFDEFVRENVIIPARQLPSTIQDALNPPPEKHRPAVLNALGAAEREREAASQQEPTGTVGRGVARVMKGASAINGEFQNELWDRPAATAANVLTIPSLWDSPATAAAKTLLRPAVPVLKSATDLSNPTLLLKPER